MRTWTAQTTVNGRLPAGLAGGTWASTSTCATRVLTASRIARETELATAA